MAMVRMCTTSICRLSAEYVRFFDSALRPARGSAASALIPHISLFANMVLTILGTSKYLQM